jgi:hypothetical protein
MKSSAVQVENTIMANVRQAIQILENSPVLFNHTDEFRTLRRCANHIFLECRFGEVHELLDRVYTITRFSEEVQDISEFLNQAQVLLSGRMCKLVDKSVLEFAHTKELQ